MKEYIVNVHKNSYNFIFAGFLLLLYELSMILLPNPLHVVNGVDAFFQSLIRYLPFGTIIVSIGIALLGIGFVIYDIKKGVILRPFHFVLMMLESSLWAVFLFLNISLFAGKIAPRASFFIQEILPQQAMYNNRPTYFLQDLGLSLGAGFYEELFFRLILFNLMYWGYQFIAKETPEWRKKLTIILITSALFAIVHHIGNMGDAFSFNAFAQRFIFGMIMNGIFWWRGFGIAAWSHALYDVYIYSYRALYN